MKAAEFDYAKAESVAEVCRLLHGARGDGKIIAGGQTLVPLLAMRLARPALLVDINWVVGLRGIAADGHEVVVGAGTRQADALADETVRRRLPLLVKALRLVGHPQTRNRGTIGGSLANADPAAEIGLAALTIGAELEASSVSGERKIPVEQFFLAAMTTALAPEECLTRIRFPIWREAGRLGTGFQEMSVRRSDFALVAAAAQLVLDRDGICRRIVLGIGGAGPVPLRDNDAAEKLVGTRLEARDVAAASAILKAKLDPSSDSHASADYRRRVVGTLAARAIEEARDEALGRGA